MSRDTGGMAGEVSELEEESHVSDEVEAAAAARDADAIYAHAMRLSARAAELEEEARRWLRDASRLGA